MNKRYQVFVSSTYLDLQEERREVIQALLELECIPAGMEMFPAATEDQWTLIKSVIDDCDYYVLIVGGRYGSVDDSGMSYTEKEYHYAVEKGKPILSFLHKTPEELAAKRTDAQPDKLAKLEAFRRLTQQRLVRFWTTPAELGSVVSRSLVTLMRTHPGIGWVRADQILSIEASDEILRLRRQVDILESDLSKAQASGPTGAADLSQGDDSIQLTLNVRTRSSQERGTRTQRIDVNTTWNAVLAAIGPILVGGASEQEIRRALGRFTREQSGIVWESDSRFSGVLIESTELLEDSLYTVLTQLRALGIIEPNLKPRSVKDTAKYWALTPYGDSVLLRLRAIKRTF